MSNVGNGNSPFVSPQSSAYPSSIAKPASSADPWPGYNGAPPASQPGPVISSQEGENLIPPPVPSQAGSGPGTTTVDTPSLGTFAANIGALLVPVKDAYTQLNTLPTVKPGLFYHAYQIQSKVNGAQSTSTGSASASNLVTNYLAVLNDLADGLTQIQNAAQQMSQKYTTFDELNQMKAAELQGDLANANTEFSQMMSANGGTGGTGPASPASPASGSGGGSGGGNTGSPK